MNLGKSNAALLSQYPKFKNPLNGNFLNKVNHKPVKNTKIGDKNRPFSASNFKRNPSNRPRDGSEDINRRYFSEKQRKAHCRKPGSARIKDNRGYIQ